MDDLDDLIQKFKENLIRDKVDVQQAIEDFMRVTKTFPNDIQNIPEEQSRSPPHPPSPVDVSLPLPRVIDEPVEMKTSHGHHRLAIRSPPSSNALFMQTPKYGLPGLGEYEEKRKQYQKEWKLEYNKYLSEVASKQKPTSKVPNGVLDYEEVLARKREEEWQYRHQNGDFVGTNGTIRPSRSEGHLNRNDPVTNHYGHWNHHGVNPRPLIKEPIGGAYDDSRPSEDYNQLHPHFLDQATNGMHSRPHSYPVDSNVGMYAPVNSHHRQSVNQARIYDDRFYRDNCRYRPDEQIGKHAERRQREFYERDADGYYRHHPYNSDVNEHFNGHHYNEPESIGRDRYNGPDYRMAQAQLRDPRTDYHIELSQQVEDVRQRRQREREEQMKYEMKIEEENRAYDPWGRGGAGAPVKDRQGNPITIRKQIGSNGGPTRHVSVVAPVMAPTVSAADDSAVMSTRFQDAESRPNYAIHHAPQFEEAPDKRAARASYENYQEDLKKQIEDKKRRDQEAKEQERLEEEKLARKVQEENEKMQRELEEESRRQKEKEEERRRRNEEMVQRQQDQKRENERKAREAREKERRERWEQREKALGQEPTSGSSTARSPPIRLKHGAINSIAKQQQSKPALPSASDASSKEHILGQLSAMRQQLEREQKMMQEQLQRQMENNHYEVFDKKIDGSNVHAGKNHHKKIPPPIHYRPITGSKLFDTIPGANLVASKSVTPLVSQPTSRKSIKPMPVTEATLNFTGNPKTLKGESFFLGVESDNNDQKNDHEQWPNSTNKTWNVYGESEIEKHKSRVNKDDGEYKKLQDENDELNDSSFLDEFMARNLQRR